MLGYPYQLTLRSFFELVSVVRSAAEWEGLATRDYLFILECFGIIIVKLLGCTLGLKTSPFDTISELQWQI